MQDRETSLSCIVKKKGKSNEKKRQDIQFKRIFKRSMVKIGRKNTNDQDKI